MNWVLNSSSVVALSRYSNRRRVSYNGPPYTVVVFADTADAILTFDTPVVRVDANSRNSLLAIADSLDCMMAVVVPPSRMDCPATNSVVKNVPVPVSAVGDVFETVPVSSVSRGPYAGVIAFVDVVRPSSRKRINAVTNSTKTGYSLSAKSGIAVLMRCVKSWPLI